jgi:hypothetical protein
MFSGNRRRRLDRTAPELADLRPDWHRQKLACLCARPQGVPRRPLRPLNAAGHRAAFGGRSSGLTQSLGPSPCLGSSCGAGGLRHRLGALRHHTRPNPTSDGGPRRPGCRGSRGARVAACPRCRRRAAGLDSGSPPSRTGRPVAKIGGKGKCQCLIGRLFRWPDCHAGNSTSDMLRGVRGGQAHGRGWRPISAARRIDVLMNVTVVTLAVKIERSFSVHD